MKEANHQLIMLGTGSALVTRCYNTCFILRMDETLLLVDAGGGNGVLSQLEKANVNISDIHDLFITHAHTDHILGAVWVVRTIAQQIMSKKYEGTFRIYGHDKALNTLKGICRLTLPEKLLSLMGKAIIFIELHDNDTFRIGHADFQCFDILSTKEKQFGFCADLSGGIRLTCLGDEPYNEANQSYAENADWLLCEAFCLYEDRDIFKPYEKHHSTALEAGILAEKLKVKNLLLYHTEDKRIGTRKQDYTAEASRHFSGRVCVPDDLEVVCLNE